LREGDKNDPPPADSMFDVGRSMFDVLLLMIKPAVILAGGSLQAEHLKPETCTR